MPSTNPYRISAALSEGARPRAALLLGALPLAVLAPAVLSSCAVLGPSCLARQQGGAVTVVRGEASAGGVTSHRLRYETAGSQNTITVSWPGAGTVDAPRLRFYVTRAACERFEPGATSGTASHATADAASGTASGAIRSVGDDEPCAVLAEAGQREGGPFASTLIVTLGRGNPLVLGAHAEYIVWVVGDPSAPATYALDVRWSFGPDC